MLKIKYPEPGFESVITVLYLKSNAAPPNVPSKPLDPVNPRSPFEPLYPLDPV